MTIKPELRGLLDEAGPPPAADLGLVSGWVVAARWADLEPTPFGPLAHPNAIDLAIARVTKYAQEGYHLALKVRIFAGSSSPAWAMDLGGGPFQMQDPTSVGSTAPTWVPRFWTPQFAAAYDHLELLLAQAYDTAPAVRDVTVSQCTMLYDEPLIRTYTLTAGVKAMLAAGWTFAADDACQHNELAIAAQYWRHTNVSISISQYQMPQPDGTTTADMAYSEEVGQYCRAVLGTRCVLGNNELGKVPDQYASTLYSFLRGEGQSLYFQLESGAKLSTLPSMLANLEVAVEEHASYVEMTYPYRDYPASDFAALAAELERGT